MIISEKEIKEKYVLALAKFNADNTYLFPENKPNYYKNCIVSTLDGRVLPANYTSSGKWMYNEITSFEIEDVVSWRYKF